MDIKPDYLIIGAGIIGLTMAHELRRRHPQAKITLIDKEAELAHHASGRNSGVLHAGFYYSAESLKAKFCKEGNLALTEYCLEHQLPINRCGKLVVTRNEAELKGLHELYQRGLKNNISLQLISAQEAKTIEPRANTVQQALFSPTTSSVNPKMVMAHLAASAKNKNIQIHLNEKFIRKKNHHIITDQQTYQPGYIINCAGLYADKIAKQFGFSQNYLLLPFKGVYLYSHAEQEKLRTHIYPVPNLANPFLGVHFTLTVDNAVKIGPTAIPALWREQYRGLSNFKSKEVASIIWQQINLFLRANFGFRQLAWQEIRKYNFQNLLNDAQSLVTHCQKSTYQRYQTSGIRAQLLNTRTRQLEMDFIYEGDHQSFHVLNSISPAFTCSFPFAQAMVDEIAKRQ